MAFTVGNSITATCLLVGGSTGQPADPPGTVFAFSRSPTGVVTPLTVAHPQVGMFTAAFVPQSVGTWVVRFSDVATPPAGATFVPEAQFVVYPLDY